MKKNAFPSYAVLRGALAALLFAPWLAWAAPPVDTDGDGVPDWMEPGEGLSPTMKDNDIFTSASLFVKQQYRDMLRREGDAAGIAFFTGQITAGTMAREQLVYAMLQSPEFSGTAAPVIRQYLAYFKRAPDYGGLMYQLEQRALGVTIEQISEAFALSPEFTATYGNKTNAEFVQLIYRNVLDRQPDAAGYSYWLDELSSGRRTRGGVMVGFTESAEFAQKTYPQVLVSMLYTGMMQRTPDADGFSYWSTKIQTGTSPLQLVNQFYISVEYKDRFVYYYSLPPTPQAIDAARFLTQASFGPLSITDITNVMKYGAAGWMEDQFARAQFSHVGYVGALVPIHGAGYAFDSDSYEAVWQQWLYSPDQLRARVAFALSEIMVISNIAPNLDPWAMSSYMDMLNKNAFGNYRQLLEEVALHPAMGFYLDMLKSQKEDPNTGRHPNENFAREVLQLFSIGLVKLNIDGSSELGTDGKPIATYDEDVVKGFAKAFSGWSFGGSDVTKSNMFFNAPQKWTIPMQAWQMQHSQGDKLLLNGKILPGFQTAEQDMHDALDSIFYHQNVGPFMCLRLIQRLVTSNPSKAYIARCATIFNNNGAGARGDLKSVVRTILLDPEARDPSVITSTTFGKQREPVIRFANFLRAFNAKSLSGRNAIHELDSPDDGLAQSPLLSPSVFNFFAPGYRPTGVVAAAGLVAPEFQITTETSVVGGLNFMGTLIDRGTYGDGSTQLKLDYTILQALALTPSKLADHINMLLVAGAMSSQLRDSIIKAVTAMPTNNTRNRVEAALMITAMSPDFVIQK